MPNTRIRLLGVMLLGGLGCALSACRIENKIDDAVEALACGESPYSRLETGESATYLLDDGSTQRFLDLDVQQADGQALKFSITEHVGGATVPGTTSRFEFSGEGGRSACAENFFGFNYNERQALILNFGSPWGAFGPASATGVSLEPGACSNASRATAAGTYSVARCSTVARNDAGQTETLIDDRARGGVHPGNGFVARRVREGQATAYSATLQSWNGR